MIFNNMQFIFIYMRYKYRLLQRISPLRSIRPFFEERTKERADCDAAPHAYQGTRHANCRIVLARLRTAAVTTALLKKEQGDL